MTYLRSRTFSVYGSGEFMEKVGKDPLKDGIVWPWETPSSRQAWGIFLLCLLIFHINGRPQPEVDCVTPPYVAWSLIRQGSMDLGKYPDLDSYRGSELIGLSDGRWVATRPIGTVLFAIPFVAPLTLCLPQPPSAVVMLHLGKFIAAFSVAGAAALFFLICCKLAPGAAWPATVLFALGTCMASVASQALWTHGPATFWLCLAFYLLLEETTTLSFGRGFLIGLFFGLAILTRPTTVFLLFATGLWIVLRGRMKFALSLIAGSLPCLLIYILANVQMGNHSFLGRSEGELRLNPTPLWIGATGLLIAPSRGLLVYSPALLLAPLGLWVTLSRSLSHQTGLLISWFGASILTLLFYGQWYVWSGGWCFGPRFLCETMPTWCLLFALAYNALSTFWMRQVAISLVGLSIIVQFLGIAGRSAHESWCLRNIRDDQGRCLFALHDTQIAAHAQAAMGKLTGKRWSIPSPNNSLKP